MKRKILLVVSLSVLLSVAFCSCARVGVAFSNNESNTESGGEATGNYTPIAIYDFSEYLDREGFDTDTGTYAWEKYKYEGKPVEDCCQIMYGDGLLGGTTHGWTDYFGYTIETWTKWNYDLRSRKFYTSIPLENLDSPYGITFEDDIRAVLTKIGIENTVIDNFVSDQGDEGVMTLQSGTDFSITLTDNDKKPDIISKYRYVVEYTESYYDKESSKDITRYVSFSFEDETCALGSLGLYIESRRENENDRFAQNLDSYGFDETFFANGRNTILNYDLSYKQDGETVKKLYGDWILDESDGTRYYIDGELLGAEIIERTDGGCITNSVRIYAKSPFYAFGPPADIDSRTPVSRTVNSLGIYINVIDDFVSDEGNGGIMTLYSNESKSLTVTDCSLMSDPDQYEYRYKIKYTQTYDSTQDGVEKTVTRYVELLYEDEESELGAMVVYIEEIYQSVDQNL